MDEAVISVSDALVFEYLKQNGHELIARELLIARKRDQLPNLHGINLKAVIELAQVKGESEKSLCEENKCANNLVFKYLLVQGHIGVAREFKSCTQSRLKEDEHKEMHLKDLLQFYNTFNHNDRSKWVPIQEVFGDKVKLIHELDYGQSEVAKVVRYILESNIPIRAEQVAAAKMKLKVDLDKFHYPTKAPPGINTRMFSFARFGASSEEYQIELARHELVSTAMVINEKKLYTDLYKLSKSYQWAVSIVGCFLSKYLKTARYPQKVFMKIAKPFVYKSGKLSEEDKDYILKCMESSKGANLNLKLMQRTLLRSRTDIQKFVKKLRDKCDKNRKGLFTLSEDTLILSFVMKSKVPQCLEDFCKFYKDPISFDSLAPLLSRTSLSIGGRWNGYLKTVILSLFHGSLSSDYRKIFFDYLISSKTESISQINWSEVEKFLPCCTKKYLTDIVSGAVPWTEGRKPLYQILCKKQSSRRSLAHVNRRIEVAKIFDELRGVKPMCDTTRDLLKKLQN